MSISETINTILVTIIILMIYYTIIMLIRYLFTKMYHKIMIDYYETRHLIKVINSKPKIGKNDK